MYIYTQDRKKIIEFMQLEVSKNTFGSAKEKYCIVATGKGSEILPVTVGYYPDETRAMNELSSIFMALNMGNTVYQVK